MGTQIIPSSIPEQLDHVKSLEISYRILHPKATMSDVQNNRIVNFPFSSIINKYRDFLYNIIIEIELSDEEHEFYQYKPKMLSEDIYGTTELWDTILMLNNATSVSEFRSKKIKLYDPTKFKKFLNEIMLLEEELGNIVL